MTTTKKEFSAIDANPSVLYAKLDGDRDNPFSFPLICDADGKLIVTSASTSGGTTTISGSVTVINTVSTIVIGTVTVTGSTTIIGQVDTELTAAVSLSDDLVNPTTSTIGALLYGYVQADGNWDRSRMAGDNSDALGTAGTGHIQILAHHMLYNGAGAWDRARGDITNGLDVDVTRVQGTVAITGSTTILGTVTVTGSTAIIGTVTVTGSTTVIGTVTVTGSTTIIGTVAITGSTSVINTVTVTGSTSVVNIVAITGSTSVVNTVTITGSTSVINTVTVTGSTSVINTVTVTGTTIGIFERVSTSTVTSVAASTASTQLLALTAGRKAAYFYNDSTASLYLKFGTTASTTSFTVLMRPNDYFEMALPVYTGRLDGIWDATNGSARITELT